MAIDRVPTRDRPTARHITRLLKQLVLAAVAAAALTACQSGEVVEPTAETVTLLVQWTDSEAGEATIDDLEGLSVGGVVFVYVEPQPWMRSVRFAVDGREVAHVTSRPFGVTIDTRTLTDGPHVLRAEALQANGRVRDVSEATFTVANGTSAVVPPAAPAPGSPDPSASLRLLSGYWQIERIGGELGNHQQVRDMRYHPWGFKGGANLFFSGDAFIVDDPGPYSGWDYLATRHSLHANVNYPPSDFVFLRLSRDATVAVVWYGSPSDLPSWLRSWQRGADVRVNGQTRATFRTSLAAGEHYLGTVEGRRIQMYSVLLAEADGTASPLPYWPSEYGERLAPGSVIPRDHILHNIHFAQGPDGRTYPSWHEQIHESYWVYFEHDHGSNPAWFAGSAHVQPVWAYSDASIGANYFFGFKVLVLDVMADDGRELSLMFTAHLDSLTERRLCERFHTLDLAVADKRTGELLMRTHMLADTGYPVDGGDLTTRIKPAACPEVASLTGTNGRRNINALAKGAYESWQYDLAHARALPFIGAVTLLQEVPLTVIGGERDRDGFYTAERLIYEPTPQMGASRHLQFSGARFGIDARSGAWGTFCTDRYARARVDCGTQGALVQYVKPGLHFTIRNDNDRYGVQDPWTGLYRPTSDEERRQGAIINVWRNLEHAISLARGNN
jgi:hypothetical protein